MPLSWLQFQENGLKYDPGKKEYSHKRTPSIWQRESRPLLRAFFKLALYRCDFRVSHTLLSVLSQERAAVRRELRG